MAAPKATQPVMNPKTASTPMLVVKADEQFNHRMSPGVRVKHATFGNGKVITATNDKVEIKFEKIGVKWIAVEYIRRLK